jgi:diadenosine tetraphosphatase ApaH/serine/threonine PP2A family protein phosphatase
MLYAALERVETAGAETLFCGHTHQPYVRELSGGSIRVSVQQSGSEPAREQEMTLPMCRIVNAGSVGEPRHGSTKATYVVHDDVSGEVSIREVNYDVAKTCQAIVEAGLPEVFAWRLSHGFEYAGAPKMPAMCASDD